MENSVQVGGLSGSAVFECNNFYKLKNCALSLHVILCLYISEAFYHSCFIANKDGTNDVIVGDFQTIYLVSHGCSVIQSKQ